MSSSTESVEVRRPQNPARNRRGAPLNRNPWVSTTDSSEEPSTSPHPDGAGHDGEQRSLHLGDDGRGRSRRDNDDGCRDESGDHRPASRDGRGHGCGLRSPPRRRGDKRARDGHCHHPSTPRNGGHHSSGRRSLAPRCDKGGGTDGRGDRPRTPRDGRRRGHRRRCSSPRRYDDGAGEADCDHFPTSGDLGDLTGTPLCRCSKVQPGRRRGLRRHCRGHLRGSQGRPGGMQVLPWRARRCRRVTVWVHSCTERRRANASVFPRPRRPQRRRPPKTCLHWRPSPPPLGATRQRRTPSSRQTRSFPSSAQRWPKQIRTPSPWRRCVQR